MKKEEFNSLQIDKQIEIFNTMLTNNSIRKVCSDIGISKTTIRDRFKNHGYTYNHKIKMYEKTEKNQDDDYREDQDALEESRNGDSKYLENKSNNLKDLSLIKKEILSIKKELESLSKKDENSCENFYIKIEKFSGKLNTKTLKIHIEVLNSLNTFMEDHPHLKQQDVITQAVYEFLNKYGYSTDK